MLEAFHTSIGHFRSANRIGHVAFEGDVLFASFVGNGEDGFARDERLKLDEIRAPVFQISDGASPILRSRDGDGTGKTRFGAIEHRARSVNMWTDEMAQLNFAAPTLNDLKFAAHIAYAGYAVRDEKRERNIFGSGKPVPKH